MLSSLPLVLWIVIFSLIGSVGSLIGGIILILKEGWIQRIMFCLISFATGTLLGAVFLGMLPKAMTKAEPSTVLGYVLIGIVLFFVLEKLLIWYHCHNEKCEIHSAAPYLILFGDAFHNFMDGVVIAAGFLISIPFGIATSLAVVAHEVPQEIGDFAILLHGGMSKKKAFVYNFLSALPTIPGALIAYGFSYYVDKVTHFILALAASSFLYIAIADLIPEIHHKTPPGRGFYQIILMGIGIGVIAFFRMMH
jgi:zinc and cadmium transporter